MSGLTLAGLGERIGQELGLSDWVAMDQQRIDAFAACTGDHQWIHVDVERAKRESPFRGTVAHGYLTLAMVAPLAMQIGVIPKDAAAGLNYGVDKARFLSAVPAGARVRLRVVLIGVEPTDAAAGLNYGIDKVRFLAPVPAGARVRLRVVLAGIEPREGGQVIMKTQNTLEVEGSERPALIAETLALLIPAKGV
jgi:acyl dehydratase